MRVVSRGPAGLMMAIAVIVQPAVPAPAAEGEAAAGKAFRYDAKGRRDPFVSLVRDGRYVAGFGSNDRGLSGDLTLRGILWDPAGTSIAMIDDVEVKVGDTIGSYQVADIQQNVVVLITSGGERMVLELAFDASSSGLPPRAATGGGGP
jgi:hypothetical protein